ncbi:MAG: amidohydrolase family protein, partial [Sphingomonadales bacterium]
DHSPHTVEEKEQLYFESKSGGPLVQHLLQMLLSLAEAGFLSLEKIVEKTCENPALFYGIQGRGFIKEGYFADCVLVDLNKPSVVKKDNLYSKCGWSVFEGHHFSATIEKTFVNGQLVFDNGKIFSEVLGQQVEISS